MASDAHCHPHDLLERHPGAELERRRLSIACAASSWQKEAFLFHEALSRGARESGESVMALCFGVHPQLPREEPSAIEPSLDFLKILCAEKRLRAIGEIGFDLFDAQWRTGEAVQTELFELQLDLAMLHGLPVVLHLRKAIDRAFRYSRELARLPAVIFHSYSGTDREARDLLSRGIRGYFSFGTPILLGHKRAIEAVTRLPLDSLLLETDAPWQPLPGRLFPGHDRSYSSWCDLPLVLQGAARLRGEGLPELEAATDRNFRMAYLL